jgi:glucose-1-phosphate thymidylyltransferase
VADPRTIPTAVIPVAGIGSRLRPHTHTVPKVLIQVAGKPMLAHILDEMRSIGVREVVLVVGYMGDRIRHFVDRYYDDLDVRYVEQMEREGLGHAVHLTAGAVDTERPLLIILGDTIFRADFDEVIASKISLIGVREVEDPRRFGIVEVDGKNRVTKLVEKPKQPTSNLAIVGIYYIKNPAHLYAQLESLIEREIRSRGEYQLTDALAMMVEDGQPLGVFTVDGWFDCGQPETLLATNRELLDLKGSNGMANTGTGVIIPPVAIAESATVINAIIGPHATVAAGAVVRNSIVRNTIINESAIVEDALLDASVIGDHAVVRGSFKKLNVGDSSEVEVI